MKNLRLLPTEMRRLKILIAAVILLGAAKSSFACSCGQVSAEQRFNLADAVLIGEVIGMDKSEFKVAVEKSWKGITTTEVVLEKTQTDCDPDFKPQKKYLIYARETEKGWQTGICEGAIEMSLAESELQILNDKQNLKLEPVKSAWHRYFYLAAVPILLIFIFLLIKLRAKIFKRKMN